MGVFVTASDNLFLVLFGKNCLCYPCSGDEGSILAWIIVSTSMARPTVAKNQRNQFSQDSDVTNGRLISSSAYFPWNMTLKYKMQLSEGSWDKIPHSKLRTVFWKEFYVCGRNSYSVLTLLGNKPGVLRLTVWAYKVFSRGQQMGRDRDRDRESSRA